MTTLRRILGVVVLAITVSFSVNLYVGMIHIIDMTTWLLLLVPYGLLSGIIGVFGSSLVTEDEHESK